MNSSQPYFESKFNAAPGDMLLRSRLYREFSAEREEILRHKWFESEKAGHDIGYDRALISWMVHHRIAWRQGRRSRLDSRTSSNGFCQELGVGLI
jgi:hypothetical protein